jgi:molybdenum cofactor cytidylyltransferase
LKTGIVILAAGSSTRMGRSKQLLVVSEKALIVHAVDTAIEAKTERVVVVLGANEKEHRAALANSKATVIVNKEWEKGMGTSLKTGLTFLIKDLADVEAVMVMVCDQPLVTAAHLKDLVSTHAKTGRGIIASAYSDTLGVPALFQKHYFDEILSLGDDEGARKIISRHSNDLAPVAFPAGAVDLDTPEDYRNFPG